MMTADEARKISGPRAADYITKIEQYIRIAAERKQFEVIIKDRPYADWLYAESKLGEQEKLAIKALRDAGYQVKLYYYEGQFVDQGLWILW